MRGTKVTRKFGSKLAVSLRLLPEKIELVLFEAGREDVCHPVASIRRTTHNNPVRVRISLLSNVILSANIPTLARIEESNLSRAIAGEVTPRF